MARWATVLLLLVTVDVTAADFNCRHGLCEPPYDVLRPKVKRSVDDAASQLNQRRIYGQPAAILETTMAENWTGTDQAAHAIQELSDATPMGDIDHSSPSIDHSPTSTQLFDYSEPRMSSENHSNGSLALSTSDELVKIIGIPTASSALPANNGVNANASLQNNSNIPPNNQATEDQNSQCKPNKDLANTESYTKACVCLTLGKREYTLLENGYLVTSYSNISFSKYITNGDNASLCYPYTQEFQNCPTWSLLRNEYDFLSQNKTVYDKVHKMFYKLGEYRLKVLRSQIMLDVCIPNYQKPLFNLNYLFLPAWTLSDICLLLSFIVYSIIPKRSCGHTKVVQCHMASLFFVYLFFILRYTIGDKSEMTCLVIGVLIHFNFLAAFCWLNVMAVDIWQMVKKSNNAAITEYSGLKFAQQSLYGWGIPSAIVGTSLVLEYSDVSLKPNYKISCWITPRLNQLLFFHGPASVILFTNVVLFVLIMFVLRKASRDVEMANLQIHKQVLRLYLKLSIVIGIFWTFEVISWASCIDPKYWSPVDILNALQGVFLFIVYICKKSILQSLKDQIQVLFRRKTWSHYPKMLSLNEKRKSSTATIETSVGSLYSVDTANEYDRYQTK